MKLRRKLRHKPQVSKVFYYSSIGIDACCIAPRSGATRSTSWRGARAAFRLRIPASPLSAIGGAGWPHMHVWLRQFDKGTNEPDLARQGFLKLFKHLRGILLQ